MPGRMRIQDGIRLECFQEKWKPVFLPKSPGAEARQNKNLGSDFVSNKVDKTLSLKAWRPLRWALSGLGLLAIAACETTDGLSYEELLGEPQEQFARIDTLYGNYLAAHEATRDRNSQAAANYYAQALKADPDNPILLERAFLFEVSAGNQKRATSLAREIVKNRPSNRLAQLTLTVDEISHNRPAKARTHLTNAARGIYNGLAIDLIKAWTLADEGKWSEANAVLDEINALGNEEIFRSFHLALMHEVYGDPAKAETHFKAAVEASGNAAIRVTDAFGRFLERHGRPEEAVEHYSGFLENHPEHPLIEQSIARARLGEVEPDPLISKTRQGAAEVLHGVSGLMAREQNINLPILYLQLALWANPDLVDARLLLGELYWQGEQYEKAARSLAKVPVSHPYAPSAGVQIALALDRLKRAEDAENVLRRAMALHPDDISATVALGDILRANEKYEQAVEAYDRAFEIVGDEKASWFLYYSRGASLELAGFWVEAERDLLAAYERAPDQPIILNHLGYSWVDRGIRLDEGLEYIQKAVDLSPGNGFIVDSLGWAYYRLGDYEAAVRYLERALELESEDPELHEHLGDAYWMMGRQREARYQWQHALDRDPPTPEKISALEAKLETGLKSQAPKVR